MVFWRSKKFIRSYLAGSIVIGIAYNAIVSIRDNSPWLLGDWLIAWPGSFIRRGLAGAIFLYIQNNCGIDAYLQAASVSIVAYCALVAGSISILRKQFPLEVVLSPLLLGAPVFSESLLRKDCISILVLLINAAMMSRAGTGWIHWTATMLFVNLLSIAAVLNHESYALIAVPILFLVYTQKVGLGRGFSLLGLARYLVASSPVIGALVLCIVNKGTIVNALAVQSLWRSTPGVASHFQFLQGVNPTGSIEAIGWSAAHAIGLSLQTLNQFSFPFWIPLAWVATILFAFYLLLLYSRIEDRPSRAVLMTFQFVFISPLFFLGVDFGRWIYMWTLSSAIVYGFTNKAFRDELCNRLGMSRIHAQIVSERFRLSGQPVVTPAILFISIPHCCWGLDMYVKGCPAFFAPIALVRLCLGFLGV